MHNISRLPPKYEEAQLFTTLIIIKKCFLSNILEETGDLGISHTERQGIWEEPDIAPFVRHQKKTPKNTIFSPSWRSPAVIGIAKSPADPGYYLQIAAKYWQTDFRVVFARAKSLYIKVIHIWKNKKKSDKSWKTVSSAIIPFKGPSPRRLPNKSS